MRWQLRHTGVQRLAQGHIISKQQGQDSDPGLPTGASELYLTASQRPWEAAEKPLEQKHVLSLLQQQLFLLPGFQSSPGTLSLQFQAFPETKSRTYSAL